MYVEKLSIFISLLTTFDFGLSKQITKVMNASRTVMFVNNNEFNHVHKCEGEHLKGTEIINNKSLIHEMQSLIQP